MDSYLEAQRRKILSGNGRYGQQTMVAVREPSRLRDVTQEVTRMSDMEDLVQQLSTRLAAVESKAEAAMNAKEREGETKAQARTHRRSMSGLGLSSRISAVEPVIPELVEPEASVADGFSFPFDSDTGCNSSQVENLTPKRLWAMWEQYRSNVDPLLKIVHASAVQHLFLATEEEAKELKPDAQSLKFAICFAAAASLETFSSGTTTCLTNNALLSAYATKLESTLAQSRFLSEPTIAAVQALTIYLITGQRFLQKIYLWSLLSILVRVAFKLKLNQDPDNQGLSFLDCEYRRRLWWHICTLDARIAELNDTDPLIYERRCTVRFPTPISDSDFDSVKDIEATRDAPNHHADTFGSLLRFELTYYLRTVQFSEDFMEENGFPILGVDGKLSVIEYLEKVLEEKYYQSCKCTASTCRLAIAASKITVARLKLTALLGDRMPQLSRDEMNEVLTSSAIILENLRSVREDASLSRWAWLTSPQAEWDAAALCLSALLLMRTKTKAVTRAWHALTLFFVAWKESSYDPALYKKWVRLEALKTKAEAHQSRNSSDSGPVSTISTYTAYNATSSTLSPVPKTPTTLTGFISPATNGTPGSSHIGSISSKSTSSVRSSFTSELDWPFPKEGLKEHADFDLRSFALMI